MPSPPASSLQRSYYWLVITVTVFFILYIGQALIIPFVLALFVWYLINALYQAIRSVKIKNWSPPVWLGYLASAGVIVMCAGILFRFINQNVKEVIEVAPTYGERIGPMIDRIAGWLPFELPEGPKEFISQFDFAGLLGKLASALGSFAGNASLISIYVMFLFLEQRSFRPKIQGMSVRKDKSSEVFKIIDEIEKDIRTYIGIKTLASALTGTISYAIMAFAGLDFAPFWGLLIFCFNYIPTVGSILATLFPSLLALIAFDSAAPIAAVIGGVTGTQILVGNVIEPKLMGSSLNLSPLVILLSLSLWGSLWGIPGMFLCVPITVIAMIICSHFTSTRPIAILLSGDGKLKKKAQTEPA